MATQPATRLSNDILELDYMKVLAGYLNTAGLWPHETLGGRTRRTRIISFYHMIVLLIHIFAVNSEILMARDRMKTYDLFDMGQDYLSIMMCFVMISRLTLILHANYRSLIKKWVTKFHLAQHAHESEFSEKEYHWINKLCRIFLGIILLECVLGQVMFNIVPLYENFSTGMFSRNRPENGTFKHSINYYFFLDQYKTTTGYAVVGTLNYFISYIAGVLFCAMDLLIYMLVFHIIGHINILVDKMRTFPRLTDQSEASVRRYNEEAARLLKGLIEHDLLIKDFMNDTSETFSIPMCICFMFHQVAGCIMLLEISPLTPEVLFRYGPLTIVLWNQLIQMSVIFELIVSKSDNLPDEVYGLPWELMDVSNRRSVLMFLRNSQTSRGLKAGGVVTVGVVTGSSIFKTSISYFLMLKTLGSAD